MKRPETIGTLSKHRKGFGFVITEDEEPDIYISARSMGGAMNGDRVLVELNPQSRGNSREGVIVKIVERCTKELVGTFEKSKRFGFVVADDPRMGEDIFVRKKISAAHRGAIK